MDSALRACCALLKMITCRGVHRIPRNCARWRPMAAERFGNPRGSEKLKALRPSSRAARACSRHQILHGNSLVSAMPALNGRGTPGSRQDAFEAVTNPRLEGPREELVGNTFPVVYSRASSEAINVPRPTAR